MTFSREFYRIGGLVKALSANGIEVTPALIRFYEGFFNEKFPFNPERTEAGQRVYSRSKAEAIYKLLEINNDKPLLTMNGLRAVINGQLEIKKGRRIT